MYIDRILKGDQVADLPVRTDDRRQDSEGLGLTVQPALVRAAEVIDMIDRRVFAVAAIAGIAIPAATRAQSILTTGKIGMLNMRSTATATVAIMRPVWQRLGYVEGRTAARHPGSLALPP